MGTLISISKPRIVIGTILLLLVGFAIAVVIMPRATNEISELPELQNTEEAQQPKLTYSQLYTDLCIVEEQVYALENRIYFAREEISWLRKSPHYVYDVSGYEAAIKAEEDKIVSWKAEITRLRAKAWQIWDELQEYEN